MNDDQERPELTEAPQVLDTRKARKTTKLVVGSIAGIAAGYVIQTVAKKYIPVADAKLYQKALLKVGVAAISTAAVAAVTREVNAEVDDFFDDIEDVYAQYTEAKKEM